MAEALFRHMVGDKADCASAGTDPAQGPDGTVAAAIAELGVAFDGQPKKLTAELAARADRLISMGCAPIPDRATDVWDLQDPAGLPIEEVRKIRDQIKARLGILIVDLGIGRPATRRLDL